MAAGANWRELWLLNHCLCVRSGALQGNLVLVRMDGATAVVYAKYGVEGSPSLTVLARCVESREFPTLCGRPTLCRLLPRA